jgi:predicted helicase
MVVDFILAADTAMRQHFGRGLTHDGVQILDAGTFTFITRLLQSGLTNTKISHGSTRQSYTPTTRRSGPALRCRRRHPPTYRPGPLQNL